MALQVGELFAALGLNTEGFNQPLSESGKKLKAFGQGMQKAGAVMTAAFTVPLVLLGKSMIEQGMNSVEMSNMFDVSFANMKDSARTWAIDTAKNLGINKFAMQQNMAQMHDLVKTMGVTADQGLDMSENLSKLAYDLASFKNIDVTEAFDKLRSGITGESEPLKAIGILVNETTVANYAYANGIAKVGTKLTESQKVLARYGVIMQQTKDAQGDLARTMDSPANKLRILKERVAEITTELGVRLLPVVSQILGWFLKLANAFAALPAPIQNTILVLAGMLAIIGPILLIAGSLISALSSIGTALMFLTGATTVWGAVTAIATGIGSAFAAVMAFILSPIGLVILAIMALIAVGILIYKNWDTIKAFLLKTWQAISAAAVAVWGALVTFFTNLWTSIANFFVSVWEGIKATAVAIWQGIITFFTVTIPAALEALVNWFAMLPERILYFIGYLLGSMIRLTIAGFTLYINLWKWIFTDGVRLAGELIMAVINWFAQLPGKIWTFLQNAWKFLVTAFTNMKASAIALVTALITSVLNWFSQLPGKVSQFITNAANSIRNGFENAKNWAVNAVRNLLSGIGSILAQIPSIFTNIFNKVISFLANLPSVLWNKAKSIASSFWEGFKNGLGIHSPSYVEKAFDAMTSNMGDNLYDMKRLVPQFQNALNPAFAGFSNGVDLPTPTVARRANTVNGAGVDTTATGGTNGTNGGNVPNVNVTVITDWKGAVKEIKTDIAKDTNSKNRARG